MAGTMPYHGICPLSGHPGYPWTYDFMTKNKDGQILHMTAKVGGPSEPRILGHDGKTYIFLHTTPSGYNAYVEEEDNNARIQAWREEQRRLYPDKYKDWKNKPAFSKKEAAVSVSFAKVREDIKEEPLVPLASPERLNEVYGKFLDLLVLESEDEQSLRKEWKSNANTILSLYPIKTIPMPDSSRINGGYNLQNKMRKQIMASLISAVGAPIGVPGFYQWKEGSDWTFSNLSGIAFPVYDSEGRIVRLRIRDAFPLIKGRCMDADGLFSFYKGEWYFQLDGKNDRVIVESPKQNIHKCEMNGLQPKGKVEGKYKNFSSFSPFVEDNVQKNKYHNGCQSGSHISLYCAPGTNYDAVFVTEGEKKGMFGNLMSGFAFITVPGVNTFSKVFEPEEGMDTSMFDAIRSRGCKLLIIAYDADKIKNKGVLAAEGNLVKKALETGIQVLIADWNIGYGKGIDDLYANGCKPKFIPICLSN